MLKRIIGKKKFIMLILGIIVGILISVVSAYAITLVDSHDVSYSNTTSKLTATNVQDAIDELYNRVYPNRRLLSNYIINLYNDGSTINKVHIKGDSAKPEVSLNDKQKIMLDNNGEYRYYGATPNNYVLFNDELWRIISVSNIKSNPSDTKGSLRVKIIRNESVGNYSWDSSPNYENNGYGINYWIRSDIAYELNNIYYNSQSGNCYNGQNNSKIECDFTSNSKTVKGLNNEARNMIDPAIYYLGKIANTDELNDIYNNERKSNKFNCVNDYGLCPRQTTWIGIVGLMYLSDYLYATDFNKCLNGTNNDYAGCKDNIWLYKSNTSQMFIDVSDGSNSGTDSFAFSVQPTGNIHSGYHVVAVAEGIVPVVYLKSNVIITEGSGMKENPYKIELS